ncbi:MAG: efflux RND transporter periplasmic adaptor subunit [Acidobacteriota bacterium]|nr:efflux RND transporter periplasmic adaptor subunit [Acidobacteriota bacterium]
MRRSTGSKRSTSPGDWPPLTALAFVSLAGLACSGQETRPERPKTEPVGVETAIAALSDVPVETVVSGEVNPLARAFPGTKLSGRVARVNVEEGQRVRAGQLLVALDRRDLDAAVARARGAERMAEAKLENAAAQYSRYEGLHARGSVTTRELEDATAAYRVAEAALASSKADLDAAQVTAEYAEIRAPFAGHVVEKSVEPGDVVAPGVPLLTLEDLHEVRLRFDVPESDVVGLRAGDPIEVELDVLGTRIEARVAHVVPAAEKGARTFIVEVRLDNAAGELKSGMFARARLVRGERRTLLVHKSAVVRRGQLEAVFVIEEPGLARLRWVRLGREHARGVEVLSGLSEGERFVVEPPARLADGAPVTER